jgi:superfamily II DNA helicase RecQ
VARRFRPASRAERALAERVVALLEHADGLATGTLMRNLGAGIDRRELERTLDALARAGALSLREDGFEKDGQVIRFRRASLRAEARGALRDELLLFDDRAPADGGVAGRRRRKRSAEAKASKPDQAPRGARDPALEQTLREWRRQLAKARGVPAFCIFNDSTLEGIARARPASLDALLEIRGAGPKLVEKHGTAILELLGGAARVDRVAKGA